MNCAQCGQSTYKSGRVYHQCLDGRTRVFCGKGCASDFDKRLLAIRKRDEKESLRQKEQQRLEQWVRRVG